MKKILLLFAALLSISVSAQNKEQKRVDKQTTQWRYELQAAVGQAAEGACLVRVWTYSSKPTIAEGQAGKNAVHGILFKGYPASSDGTRISGREPMISNPAIEEEYSEYSPSSSNPAVRTSATSPISATASPMPRLR